MDKITKELMKKIEDNEPLETSIPSKRKYKRTMTPTTVVPPPDQEEYIEYLRRVRNESATPPPRSPNPSTPTPQPPQEIVGTSEQLAPIIDIEVPIFPHTVDFEMFFCGVKNTYQTLLDGKSVFKGVKTNPLKVSYSDKLIWSDMTNALATVGSTNTTVLPHVVDKYIADRKGRSITRLQLDEIVRRTAAKESGRKQNAKRILKRKLTNRISAAKAMEEQRDCLNERLRMLYDEEEEELNMAVAKFRRTQSVRSFSNEI
ncbi:uncharacterized protein LOC134819604 [Bolinopsis microptera]|uniref:uncharacterized protein LOC134819604 n=1 Tax=Bolinopsis microptera TaxID=2820187 RepID=UPI00307A7BC8